MIKWLALTTALANLAMVEFSDQYPVVFLVGFTVGLICFGVHATIEVVEAVRK